MGETSPAQFINLDITIYIDNNIINCHLINHRVDTVGQYNQVVNGVQMAAKECGLY